MYSILNRALSWAITSFGNEFCLKKRSRLIKALDNRFYVKFMQLEIGLLLHGYVFSQYLVTVDNCLMILSCRTPRDIYVGHSKSQETLRCKMITRIDILSLLLCG